MRWKCKQRCFVLTVTARRPVTCYKADGEILTREIPASGDVHGHPLPPGWVTSNGKGAYVPVQFLSQWKGKSDGDLETPKQRQNWICLIHSNVSSPEDAISSNCRSGKAPSHGSKLREQDNYPRRWKEYFNGLRGWHDVEAPCAPTTNRPLLEDPQCWDAPAWWLSAGCGAGQLCTHHLRRLLAPTGHAQGHCCHSRTAEWVAGSLGSFFFAGRGARAKVFFLDLLITCPHPPCSASLFSFFFLDDFHFF